MDSHQYAQGTSTTVGGSATAGFASGAPTGALGLSFSHTVSSTVNYSMDDIEYTLNSSTREVCYDYEAKNVNVYDSDDNKDEATTALSSVNATKIDDK